MTFNGTMLETIRRRLPELNEEAAKVVLGASLICALELITRVPDTVPERVARLLKARTLR